MIAGLPADFEELFSQLTLLVKDRLQLPELIPMANGLRLGQFANGMTQIFGSPRHRDRSVAANITNQQAVPIQQNQPGPIKMTLQPAEDGADDGAGQQADRPSDPALDSRVKELEEDLAETNRLLLEISKQMQKM